MRVPTRARFAPAMTAALVAGALAISSTPSSAADLDPDLVPPAPVLAKRPKPPMRLGVPGAEVIAPPGRAMRKVSGTVWIEGPGFDIKYGQPYKVCAERCLAHPNCVMIEYYRPELKCNL